MSYVLYYWHAFLALHPWGYAVAAAVALGLFIKRKTIGAVTASVWRKTQEWFWGWVRENVGATPQTVQAGQIQFRTYRGSFQDYYYKSLPFPCHILEMTCDGFSVKLEVVATNLFEGIKRGMPIEVDTEAAAGPHPELVKRVRRPQDS